MDQCVGRRDRKKRETREALRSAAVRLTLQRGYDNVTIEAITEAADVSVRTFFNYFESKEDAVLGLEADPGSGFATALAARPAGESPMVALRAVFIDIAGDLAAKHVVWRERSELFRANPQLWPRMIASFAAFEDNLTAAVAERSGCNSETSVYPGVVAAAAAGAMRVALHQWKPTDDPEALTQLLTSAFDVLVRGLVPPAPGRKRGGAPC